MLSFVSLMRLALSNGCFQCGVLLLQEILKSIAVSESFNDLVTYVLLCTIVCAEVTLFASSYSDNEEIVKHLTRLLYMAFEVSAFH